MRIALVNHRYAPFPGGSERHAQVIVESLAQRGHEMSVVTSNAFDLEYFWDNSCRRVDAPEAECLNAVNVRRVPVRHLPLAPILFGGSRRLMGELSRFPFPPRPLTWLSRMQPLMPSLASVLREISPLDIVHVTNLGLEGLAVTAANVARDMSAALVVSPFVHLGESGDRIARRFVTMPHQRQLLMSADAVIVMTEMERSFVLSQGIAPHRIVVTGAGTDVAAATGGDGEEFRARHGLQGFVVGFLGPLAREKGAFDLVRAVASLRHAGRDVALVLAGPTMSQFESWFSTLIDDERSGVRVLGVISDAEKRDLLAGVDVCALPSRTESFGIVYTEAWANRKPVIAADAGAVPELVRHEENGLLVKFGDVEGIAIAVARLMDDPALAATLGQRGCEETVSRHTWDHVIERTMKAYEVAVGYRMTGVPGHHG